MSRVRWTLFLAGVLSLGAQPRPAAPPAKPKLVLGIVVDQFRYDYLTRFADSYTGGLKRLLDHGAVFTNAHYEQFPTVTAVGHSTFLSGATPAMSGIIGNEWWDRAARKRVTAVGDANEKNLGGKEEAASPRRLVQSTLGDELKMSGKGGKVIGISIKARGAILPSGHMADAAYWFDGRTGNFASSTYYFKQLPPWVGEFNAARPADRYAGREWMGHTISAQPGEKLYGDVEATPWGNELIQQFALKALAAEKLGTGPGIDLLTVSYSSNDYVGHAYGPDAPEVRDMALRVDRLIGALIGAAEAQAGAGKVLVVFIADHGVAPQPEVNQARRMPGGRVYPDTERDAVEQALTGRFGAGPWIADISGEGIYLDLKRLADRNVDRSGAEAVAAEALRALPFMFRVYTRSQLLNGAFSADQVGVRVRNGFYAPRSADLTTVLLPYWIASAAGATTGATHGAPFDYDAHVPIIFYGAGIAPHRYSRNVKVNDIAPTLATMLDIETPSGSIGEPLEEILK